jgi:hypothetical protein
MSNSDKFKQLFSDYLIEINEELTTSNGEWIVKGFIDIFKNVYTISIDTKVVSKIIELMILPKLMAFAEINNYDILLSDFQNHYPDLTFIDKGTQEMFAVDIKSTYRKSPTMVNGMTLGAFTGYFRERSSNKNTKFPYSSYATHFVLGILYSQTEALESEMRVYTIDEISTIKSVVKDFQFFFQEKWKIASDRPGSGNTKNIGSARKVDDLINGTGLFTKYSNGEEIFNDYWMYYMTSDMARGNDLEKPPYSNITNYLQYKQIEPKI